MAHRTCAIVFFTAMFISAALGATAKAKVAIVGGGIAGTSCAFFLNNLFGREISITLFERLEIGGRLATVNIGGDLYESGGTVIHPRNKYMMSFVSLLGLKPRFPPQGQWGIYDGKEFLFRDSRWTAITLGRLLWRYGWDPVRLNSVISSLLDEFNRIYAFQDKGVSFTTVQKLLHSMSPRISNMTQQTLSAYMRKEGFQDKFMSELVEAVMHVNYGQTNSINAFAGAVSLAGSESGLWSVQNGNKEVPIGLLARSGARRAKSEVADITLLDNGTFRVTSTHIFPDTITKENYDIVVLATPLIAGLEPVHFGNFSERFSKYEGEFHRTVVTFIMGMLKQSAFHDNSVPDAVLVNVDDFIFNSVGLSSPVTGDKPRRGKKVYKVFSKLPLTDEEIRFLFDDVEAIQIKDWFAYPHYLPPENIAPFMIYPNLYYINAIEWAASAMEMSSLAARNVALLIYNKLQNRLHLIDPELASRRDEL